MNLHIGVKQDKDGVWVAMIFTIDPDTGASAVVATAISETKWDAIITALHNYRMELES